MFSVKCTAETRSNVTESPLDEEGFWGRCGAMVQGHGSLLCRPVRGTSDGPNKGQTEREVQDPGRCQFRKMLLSPRRMRFMNECAGGLEGKNEVRMPISHTVGTCTRAGVNRRCGWRRRSGCGSEGRHVERRAGIVEGRGRVRGIALNLRFIWIGLFIAGCHEYLSTRPRPEFRSLFPPRPSQKSSSSPSSPLPS